MNLIDRMARNYLRRRGFTIIDGSIAPSNDYTLIKYEDSAGNFDYATYAAIQMEGNKRKIDQIWADEATIGFICDYLRATGSPISNGLCHGSRNGAEVRWFAEKLGIDVTGTDISDTATQYGLVQWDFHEPNPLWVGKFDFVYTNSHDHAYDPKKALGSWIEQLSPTGKLFLEHTYNHTAAAVTKLDPFGVDPKLLPYVVLQFADGDYAVTRILYPPHTKRGMAISIFVLERTSGQRRASDYGAASRRPDDRPANSQ